MTWNFIYDDISNLDMGLVVVKSNQFNSPEKQFKRVEILGRNGDLIIDNNSYKNKVIDIECVIDGSVKVISSNIKAWLQSDMKYKKLIFKEDFEHYYEAVCINKLDIEKIITTLGKVKLSFDCKPFRRATSGDDPIIITNFTNIFNDGMTSHPIIKVYGSGDITININNENLILKGVENEIVVDSEFMNCYKITNGLITNENHKMYSNFPKLLHGSNNITWIGNISKIELTPRWAVL